MYFEKLHYLPLIIFFWFILTFVGLYALAVARKDVLMIFPYISDTGTHRPESCLFGQLLNVGSILLAIVIYIRYRQIKEILDIKPMELISERLQTKNTTCLYLGWIASFGVGVVANFQETVLFVIHLVGAGMAFGLASIYQCMMWEISVKLNNSLKAKTSLNNLRGALAIISVITFVICLGFAAVALIKFHGNDITKWRPEDGGYEYHLTSTISEWICAVVTMGFILTYYSDFKNVRLEEPRIELLN